MKRFFAAVCVVLCAFVLGIVSSAQEASFELTPETAKQFEALEYMPEQGIYHFTRSDSISADIPVHDGIYVYVTAGGYRSPANGVTDNGINCVCTVKLTFFDENGDVVVVLHADPLIFIPADGAFHRWSIGTDAMYAGLTDNIKRATLTVSAKNDTAYIKSMYIASSDIVARNMSGNKWEVNDMGNINAQTTMADRLIMIGFVCAVALIMMIVAKVRQKYKRGK